MVSLFSGLIGDLEHARRASLLVEIQRKHIDEIVKEHPTFELDEHVMSSWTCGLDKVFIPTSFGRPINIGVYGHPRFDLRLFITLFD